MAVLGAARAVVTGLVLVVAPCITLAEQSIRALAQDHLLFRIAKSTNRNEVHYSVHLDGRCELLDDDQFSNIWRMYEEGPDETSTVRIWERPGYGYKVEIHDPHHATLRLRPAPEHAIDISTATTHGACQAYASGVITGTTTRVYIDHIYADVDTSTFFPSLHSVDVHGQDQFGSPITARIYSKESTDTTGETDE